MQELFIEKSQEKKAIALVENGKLQEFYNEEDDKTRLEGNIYVAKVKDVLKGMQAAFVDIGEKKNAFLHIKDLIPKTSNITGNKEENLDKYKISDYIKANDDILVQVKKDSVSTKGAIVTTNIKITGRFIVLLTENNFITTSHKIENKDEAERLKNIVKEELDGKNIGAIIRTAADGKSKEEIKRDIQKTLEKLEYINKESKGKKAPKEILKSQTILDKLLLDLIDNDLERIVVNDKKLLKEIEEKISKIDENINIKIELCENNIFDIYELNSQIEKIENRKIWLKCGGFITIDKTEALTAIDVNSGKYSGGKSLEQTILKVNKEASIEIAKQLRLRDIGGIIVIDYIDMFEEKSKEEIKKVLKEYLSKDRTKIEVYDFTKLGLLEIARKHMFSGE